MLSEQERAWFDEQLDLVVDQLPQVVKDLMEQVPMVVDDRPTPARLRELGIRAPEELQGLYVGVSLDKKSFDDHRPQQDIVYLFREGIMFVSSEENGTIPLSRLREEIRKTILHEYGHHHGMDEDELEELGY